MQFVTFRLGLLLIVVSAGFLVAAAAAAPPHYTFRDVAFVTITGHGTVTTRPRGIDCPRVCRAVFLRGTHLRFTAKPAPGWRLAGYGSRWCGPGIRSSCAFDLVSPHDCAGGACPIGAYGVRVEFVRPT